MASKKITSFVPLQIHLLEIRRLVSWNTSHYRGEDLSFFSSPSFLPMTFVYVCSENALNISGFLYFMRLATYECRRQTTISFANLSKIYLSRPFEDDFPVHYMLHYLASYFGYEWGVRWQCLHAIITLLLLTEITLYWKTWKPYLFNPSKKLSYCGETFPNGCTKI